MTNEKLFLIQIAYLYDLIFSATAFHWIKPDPLKKYFNTSGTLYKDLKLREKLSDMSEDEQIKLLSTDGMLVKRPMLVAEDVILVGFKEYEWKDKLK